MFLLQAVRSFKRNQGLLLSGAVAYYTLLSIVPLFALMLVVLSHFIDQQQLFHIIEKQLELMVPGYARLLSGQVRAFFERRHLVGVIGIPIMLFFSSMAFTVLESAMAVIFSHRARVHRRHFLISAVIPYAYIFLLGIGIVLVTMIAGGLGALENQNIAIFNWSMSFKGSARVGLYFLEFLGLALLLTSLYKVMPVGPMKLRHALIGGVTAAVLWEICRHVLVWYFANLSLVNVIYGSLAAVVVALLSIEIAATILLFGAQVIAEVERGRADAQQQQSRAL